MYLLFEPIVDQYSGFWKQWLRRFDNADHPFYWAYIVIFITLLTVLYLLSKANKNLLLQLKNCSSKKIKEELWFDVKNYIFKILFEPLIIILSGLYIHKLSKVVSDLQIFKSLNFSIFVGENIHILSVWKGFYFLLVWDFAFFVAHFLQHKVTVLWFFHAYHHRANSLNPLTKYRIHPIGTVVYQSIAGLVVGIFSLIYMFMFGDHVYMPILEVGLFHRIVFFSVVHTRHSHIPIRYGQFLSKIFISPAMHQVHHSIEAQHVEKNYGVLLSIWDRFLGTIYIPHKGEILNFNNSKSGKKIVLELYRPFNKLYDYFMNKSVKRV